MQDLEACAIAGEMLRTAGFVRQHSSLRSEAVYYSWPGRHGVIRVACHKAGGNELGGVPVVAFVTFAAQAFSNGHVPRGHVVRLVAKAIGDYLLVTSGAVRANAKYRYRWPDGNAEIDALKELGDT